MSEELIECAAEGCDEVFVKKVSNQKYHNDECCRKETNRKIMEKYYDNRARLLGKERMCKQCKTTKLSRYNEKQVCAACELKNEKNRTSLAWSALVNILA